MWAWVFLCPVAAVANTRIPTAVNHRSTVVAQPHRLVDDFRPERLDVSPIPPNDRLQVAPHNTHRDGRVELDLAPDEMLERCHAALPVVVALRHDALPAPQLDKEVRDVGDRDAELRGVPGRRLVVAVLPEGGEEVLPLLDGDADIAPLWLGRRALGVLAGSSSRAWRWRRHHKDIGGCCRLKWRPRRRAGRVIDIVSQRVVVTEVDVIELPVDHDWEVSLRFLFE